MSDVWLLEKMAHFNREVIPERRMHAKGWGAYGYLQIMKDISKYTYASVLQKGEKTECFVRLSTVAGERGAADTERDIRDCAIKLYTKEGNWDIVGNNTPVFFLRDVHNFVGLNRAVKRDPATGLHDANNTWDFWTMLPEAFHQIAITMSDRGIPAALRNMDMFGENTFSLINKEGNGFGSNSTSRPSKASNALAIKKPRRLLERTATTMAATSTTPLPAVTSRSGSSTFR